MRSPGSHPCVQGRTVAAIHVYRAVPDSLSVEAAVKQPPGASAAAAEASDDVRSAVVASSDAGAEPPGRRPSLVPAPPARPGRSGLLSVSARAPPVACRWRRTPGHIHAIAKSPSIQPRALAVPVTRFCDRQLAGSRLTCPGSTAHSIAHSRARESETPRDPRARPARERRARGHACRWFIA